jgi:hypothetical protein
MTGQIIQFQSHCDLKRGRLYREQPVPRRTVAIQRPSRKAAGLELQVARIARLLNELEALTYNAEDIPPALLSQARSGIARARGILHSPLLNDEIEGEPQPDIDAEKLERMYRDINVDA